MTSTGEMTVVVAAPTGRDAPMICDILSRKRIVSEICLSVPDVCRRIGNGVGVVVLAEEVLTPRAAGELSAAIAAQPKWSDIELILLTSNANRVQSGATTTLLGTPARSVVVLERPLRVVTLVSAVGSALNSRRRQYELRDYLEERERQEERMRQTQKLESIGVLAGGIAHDFNNLLTVILGNASLALDRVPHVSSLPRLLTNVVEASQRAAHLTAQLLAYAGKARFVLRSLDLSEHVRQISGLLETSIPRTVQLSLRLPSDLPHIEADAAQVQQVVMNLVINAAEAIPEGQTGTVQVATGIQDVDDAHIPSIFLEAQLTPGRYVSLEVQDVGIGMDEKTLGCIFDPFFTTKFTGRGLGLAAVLGIVRNHKGGIGVSSTPGQGTTFRILFPAIAPEHIPVETITAEAPLAGAGTVLVIDDEELVRGTARAALERYGYSVLEAGNGERGIELFRSRAEDVAVVLLDMTMPVMSGEETFRHLKTIRPDVKVILSSGYDEFETTRRFTAGGLAGFLQKPYSAARLAETIRSSLSD